LPLLDQVNVSQVVGVYCVGMICGEGYLVPVPSVAQPRWTRKKWLAKLTWSEM
jgi:hypothetical protein